jgi:hypothetical protein
LVVMRSVRASSVSCRGRVVVVDRQACTAGLGERGAFGSVRCTREERHTKWAALQKESERE